MTSTSAIVRNDSGVAGAPRSAEITRRSAGRLLRLVNYLAVAIGRLSTDIFLNFATGLSFFYNNTKRRQKTMSRAIVR